MKRSALFALSVLTMCSATVLAQEQKPPAADPLKVAEAVPKVGDTWTYVVLDPFSKAQTSEFVVTTTSFDTAQIKSEVKTSSGQTAISITDREGRLVTDTQRTYMPPKQTLSYPLEVGKTWEYSATFPYARCGTSKIDIKAEVVGWETVTVPAGTYRALRVKHAGYWNNCLGSDKHRETYWYVPALKTHVRVETVWGTLGGSDGGNTYELKSAKLD